MLPLGAHCGQDSSYDEPYSIRIAISNKLFYCRPSEGLGWGHFTNECEGYGAAAGYAIARLCYETLLSHGATAKRANERNVVPPALDRIVEANTLLSGIGFESAGLATAHSIHNGLTALAATHIAIGS